MLVAYVDDNVLDNEFKLTNVSRVTILKSTVLVSYTHKTLGNITNHYNTDRYNISIEEE